MGFMEKNEEERLKFVDLWSKYVLEHSDRVWSRQQNIIINSSIKTANMSKHVFLDIKSKK